METQAGGKNFFERVNHFDGGTYSRLWVERAATFELVGDKWKLKQAGKIFLSA